MHRAEKRWVLEKYRSTKPMGGRMPTRVHKGDHGKADGGSKLRGGQKATYGSGVDPEVADAQAEAIQGEDKRDDDRA